MKRVFLLLTVLVAAVLPGGCSSTTPGSDGAAAASSSAAPDTAAADTASDDAGLSVADAEITRWVDEERIPGAVLVVARGGSVVFEKAYGYAQLFEYDQGSYGAAMAGEARPDAIRRLDAPIAMQPDTVFDLASVTKMMATTFAVMLLVDDGRLDLDSPVRQYLPDFGTAGNEPTDGGVPGGGQATDDTAKGRITIRQLLTHRSGLSQWQPVYYAAGSPEGAYDFIRDFPLAWAPGAERHYSDLGFMVLGLIVERISGQSLGDFVGDRLYTPLGLSATGFGPPAGGVGEVAAATDANADGRSEPQRPRFAATSHGNPFEHRMVHDPDFGYRIEGDPEAWDGWRRYTLAGEVNDGNAYHAFGGEAGHAGLFSTAAEVRILLQLLLDGGELGGRRYLSAAVVDEFLADTGDGQALGWLVPDYLPAGSFHHTGFTGTYVAGIPARDLVVVLLTNRQNVGVDDEGGYPDVGELQRTVVTAVAGER